MKGKKRGKLTRGRGVKGRERLKTTLGKREEKRPHGAERMLTPGMLLTGMLLSDRRPKLIPLAGGSDAKVYIQGELGECAHGDIVRARVSAREGKRTYYAQILERLSTGTDALSRTRALAVGFGLHMAFDREVLAQAEQASAQPLPLGDPQREDFRRLESFTIDGADAKDFDDALSVGDAPAGLTRLYVHIADVSHYVQPGTPMDQEALTRGTSVYFPNLVLPMLPEALSNGCCSLRPGEDRLTLTCVMDVDAAGSVRAHRITPGVIRSCCRFTYDQVNALFADETALDACPQGKALARLRTLARTLNRRRLARGAVDIDLPEPKIATDAQGEVLNVTAPARGESERLIEECMLLANETVARVLREAAMPALYRVHEQPDPEKTEALKRFAKKAGFSVKGLRAPVTASMLSALLEQAKGQDLYPALAMLTMRSMQKARYDAAPLGHFALAATDYCHFTSPIRRYPDLFVHRALYALAQGDEKAQKQLRAQADEAAALSSQTEVTATDAERAVDKMMMARWASAHVGEVFDAHITGVTGSGFFAALPNLVEGMSPVWTMRDEFVFDEETLSLRGVNTGVRYTVGMRVRVRIESVQEVLGRIDLAVCEREA